MVAVPWQWDSAFMLLHFGWKAAVAVVLNATLAAFVLRRHHTKVAPDAASAFPEARMPLTVVAVHLVLLAGVIALAHYPVALFGTFLSFLSCFSASRAL